MYHFLSGYTAKVAGTERGLIERRARILRPASAAPFLPRHPPEYANLLRELHRQAPCRLLAGQHRLDRRQLRRRPRACRSSVDARAAHRRRSTARSAAPSSAPILFRFRGADLGAGRRAASALSGEDLGGQGRVRRDRRASSSACSSENFEQVRGPCRRCGEAAAPTNSLAARSLRPRRNMGFGTPESSYERRRCAASFSFC